MGQSPEPPQWPYGTGTPGAGLRWPDQQQGYPDYGRYPGWPPPPPPPRRSGGSGFLIVVFVVIFAAMAFAVGRVLLHTGAADPRPTVSGGPVGDTNTQPSGRQPGVVDVDTILGFRSAQAAGTGIVLNSTGTILTNNHVIAGATTIRVTDTDNGRTYKARVVGYAKSNDVAVLRLVNAHGLKVAALGDSSKVAQGDVVTAVGNAGGKGGDPTVVTGSVTGLGQSIVAKDESDGTSENLKGLIQTSAPIQPGDSGGPLLNTKGQVIGMDTAASAGFQLQRNQDQQARGFAIPINQAMPIVRKIEAGTASSTVHIGRTALLGVQVRSTGKGGAQVSSIFQGTPADSAGIDPGSEITSLDGQPVDSANTLTELLLRYHPGDTVRLGWTDPTGGSRAASIRLADGPPQ